MKRSMLGGKIHRATVTDAEVEYEGSITIDSQLMEAAGIVPFEQVSVWSLTNGERLETYAIPGKPGGGEICMNGAAAHRIKKGERVIIASFVRLDDDEIRGYSPRIVFVDERNRIRKVSDGASLNPVSASR